MMFDESPDALTRLGGELQRVGFIGALIKIIGDDENLRHRGIKQLRDLAKAKLTAMAEDLGNKGAEREAFYAVRRLRAAIRLHSRKNPNRDEFAKIEKAIADMRPLVFRECIGDSDKSKKRNKP
jgi:hypothetical protein